MGYPVFYSDQEAKEILSNDPAVRNQIKDLFGTKAYNGEIPDNAFIADVVFKDPSMLDALNQIVHPAVRQKFSIWAQNQNSSLVFNEAAILFESGSYRNFSKTVLITSPTQLRMERILKRDQSTVEKIKSRMQNQWSDEQKIPLADFVITNDEKSLIIPQVLNLLKKLQA
jgi:dephospho-CoA kinase